ncbi:glutamate racemase [Gilvimarinus xylanilyticus]|uniref:Glutamate racemase n=1 Tax=Gilvimarinus xylanilyticus TaxID=2944139 RepID=A0A9X2HUC5_9GAMM|nr:glutamate racemase [Gilvimarinus xylanilyticus]MCP8898390.1 glutamate racemase [Gilvimarinus xylanilyticus]
MTQYKTAPAVLVFDSGVGGLSVSQHIRTLLPGAHLNYLFDNAGFPYGEKSEEYLLARSSKLIGDYLQRRDPHTQVIVIACNTASTLVLPELRKRFRQPIVGVVPAIKPAAASSQSRYIGLLATPGTIKRPYTRHLISDFADGCHVVTSGSRQLVTLAEAKLRGETIAASNVRACLEKFLLPSPANPKPDTLDTLVLACTHFPLLRSEISELLGPGVTLMDSGEAIARRVAYWLIDELKLNTDSPAHPGSAYYTQSDGTIEPLRPAFTGHGYATLRLL